MFGRSGLEKRGKEVNTLCNTVLIRLHFHFLPVQRYLIGNIGRKIYIYFNLKKLGTNFTYILIRKSLVLILHTKMYVKFGPRLQVILIGKSLVLIVHTKNVCKMCTKTSSHFRTKKLGTNFTYKKCM